MANLDEMNARLTSDPQYKAALDGTMNFGQFPVGSDGRVLPGYRHVNARAYADSQGIKSNYAINDSGQMYDQNDEPWYADPRIMGPAVVGGMTLGAGLLGGGAAAAGGGLSEAAIPTAMGVPGGALPGVGAASGMTGASAMSGAGGIGSFLSQNKNWLAPVIGAGAGLMGRALTPQANTQVSMPPELQQLLTEATRRQMNQGPLSDAVTRQALAGLPNYAKG